MLQKEKKKRIKQFAAQLAGGPSREASAQKADWVHEKGQKDVKIPLWKGRESPRKRRESSSGLKREGQLSVYGRQPRKTAITLSHWKH